MSQCKMCGGEPKFLFRCCVGKEVVDMFLCESCYKSSHDDMEPVAIIGEEIVVKGTSSNSLSKKQIENALLTSCRKCKTNLLDISRSGKFGCDECYDAFSDMLAVADAQIESHNVVKKSVDDKKNLKDPEEKFDSSVKDGRLKVLETRLKDAISKEDYEKAAEIRDLIKTIQQEGE